MSDLFPIPLNLFFFLGVKQLDILPQEFKSLTFLTQSKARMEE